MAPKGKTAAVITTPDFKVQTLEVKGQTSIQNKATEAKDRLAVATDLSYCITHPTLNNMNEDCMMLILKIEKKDKVKNELLNDESRLSCVINNWLSHQNLAALKGDVLQLFLKALDQNTIEDIESGKIRQSKKNCLSLFFQRCACRCQNATSPTPVAPITKRTQKLQETAREQLETLINKAHFEIMKLKTYVENVVCNSYEQFSLSKPLELIGKLNAEVDTAVTTDFSQITDRLIKLNFYENFDKVFKELLRQLDVISSLYQQSIPALKNYKRTFGVWDITIEFDPKFKPGPIVEDWKRSNIPGDILFLFDPSSSRWRVYLIVLITILNQMKKDSPITRLVAKESKIALNEPIKNELERLRSTIKLKPSAKLNLKQLLEKNADHLFENHKFSSNSRGFEEYNLKLTQIDALYFFYQLQAFFTIEPSKTKKIADWMKEGIGDSDLSPMDLGAQTQVFIDAIDLYTACEKLFRKIANKKEQLLEQKQKGVDKTAGLQAVSVSTVIDHRS